VNLSYTTFSYLLGMRHMNHQWLHLINVQLCTMDIQITFGVMSIHNDKAIYILSFYLIVFDT